MDRTELEQALNDLQPGAIRYYKSIGSTNREAISWAKKGAPDLGVIIADEQTSGYGRHGRRWYTPRGVSLAISIILKPPLSGIKIIVSAAPGINQLTRLTALGALAVTESLREEFNLNAKIKWPNDVLVNGYKLAGILAEALWMGDTITGAVIGIGVNVREGSVPGGIDLDAPANWIENLVGVPVDRATLAGHILENLTFWRKRIYTDSFMERWEKRLAYLGEWVSFTREAEPSRDHSIKAKVLGLEPDGSLRIQTNGGAIKILNEASYRISPGNNSK